MAAGDLCTVEEVRQFLQKQTLDSSQDFVVDRLITAASKAVTSYCEREFAPIIEDLERVFEVELDNMRGFLSLAPYDLQTVESLEMDSNLDGFTLSTDEYRLFPVAKPEGVWTSVRLAPLSFSTTSRVWWPQRQITITGTWGFPSVPDDVRQAAVITAATWLRRDVSAFSTTYVLDEDRVERPEALPSAVRAMLSPYRRMSY